MPALLPNTGAGLATFYNMIYAARDFQLPPHLIAPCHALMDQRIYKLAILIGPGAGKSALFSTVFPAFSLGQNPETTIIGISAGEALMQGFVRAVMEWIEFDPVWREVFPGVTPNKTAGWSTENGLFVTGRKPGDPDASYVGVGLTSKKLTGLHGRLVLMDDLHDKENSTTEASCQKVIDSLYSTIYGRADPRGARYLMAGRRWSQSDIYAHIKEQGDWVVMEIPAIRDKSQTLYWDIYVPTGLECCFNEKSVSIIPNIADVR